MLGLEKDFVWQIVDAYTDVVEVSDFEIDL